MIRTILTKRNLLIVLIIFSALTCFNLPASAEYSTGFKSSTIEITSPSTSGMDYNGEIAIEGLSELSRVWFCVRGPAGEIVTYPADVNAGRFHLNIWLRFGPGNYTIWAGDNPTRFDGLIRFEVINKLGQDTRYISPSTYIDSNHPDVVTLANNLVTPKMSEMEKLQAIHDWVIKNLSYDYQAYLTGKSQFIPASEILKIKRGVCKDYAFVVAALARAAGLQARVVYGLAMDTNFWAPQNHAWNEIYVDGRWVTVDATWDAGYIENGSFVGSPSTKFFNPDTKVFALTHIASTYAIH